MKTTVTCLNFIAASVVASLLASGLMLAQSDANRLTMPFTDPSRPGTVIVSLLQGSVTVRASSGRDVTVTSAGVREVNNQASGRAAGLRRLSRPAGLSITQENNVMTIGSDRFTSGDDVEVQVPARTHLKLNIVNGDEVVVERIEGDIEVNSMNGEITLTDVSGTVVAHATNGDVRATLRQVTADKPMAFTSLNGDVDVTLPASVRANLKLRSDQGEVYTDFDVQIQQQRPRPSPRVVVPPTPPLPLPTPPVARVDPDSVKAREREVRERARQARERARSIRVEVDTSIYGSINGGGPEFELRTFNGDVYLRKGK